MEFIWVEKFKVLLKHLQNKVDYKSKFKFHIGFLSIFSKKWFSKDWSEIFVILCEVGLILFKKAGELEPLLFIPIVDALVIKHPIDSEK